MSPRARRGWTIAVIAFFVVMCGAIAYSQWYAINVNVPKYEAQKPAKP